MVLLDIYWGGLIDFTNYHITRTILFLPLGESQGSEESLQGDHHPAGAAASFHPARCGCTAPEKRAAPENAKAWAAGVGSVRRENGCRAVVGFAFRKIR